jgi:DNA-binding beta-propeller fold protein YncE
VPLSGALDLAIAFDSVWVATERIGSQRIEWAVQRLEVVTARVLATIPVPGVIRRVSVGAGHVWAYGGGDGAEPNGGIAAIDPASNRIDASFGWIQPFGPYDMTFTGDTAWVTSSGADEVLRLRFSGSHLAVSPVRVGHQPTDVVATADGTVWVWNSLDGTISGIDPKAGRVRATYPWRTGLLAGDGHFVWADGGGQLVQLTPDLLAQGVSVAEGARIPVKAISAVPDDLGVWVASSNSLARYLRRSLASDGQPVFEHSTSGDVRALAATAKSAWFITAGFDGVSRWSAPPG